MEEGWLRRENSKGWGGGRERTKAKGGENDMWQSHVEIEGYSVAYFDRIAVFVAPYR